MEAADLGGRAERAEVDDRDGRGALGEDGLEISKLDVRGYHLDVRVLVDERAQAARDQVFESANDNRDLHPRRYRQVRPKG